MNARFYDPILGRHTSADPTVPDPANAQAFNRYSYVLNNALVFTDPTGLSPSTNGFADHGGGMWDTTFVNESPSPAAAGAGRVSGVPSGSEQSCTPANTSKDSIGPSQPSPSERLRAAATGNGIATAAVGVAESVSRALAAFHVTTIDDIPYDYMTGRFLSPGAAQDARIETVIFGAMSAVVPGAGTEIGELKQSVKAGADVAKGSTSLFRAVGPEELADIGSTGALRNLGSAEGKYFTTSAPEASAYAKQAVKAFGNQPYTIIRTDVPNSIFKGLSPATVDRGIPAWVIPTDRVPGLVPRVMDHSPSQPAGF